MYPQLAGIGMTTMTSRYIIWQDERADSETLYRCERSIDLIL